MEGAARLSFLGQPLPPAFRLRVVAVAPGAERPYEPAEWKDAMVVVERGEIELETVRDGRRRYERGDVLWLTGLPLRALRNRGGEPAVLVAVTRRAT
jgi:quercetin dioxygenase-like cupin family protein